MPEILTESFCERCGTRYTFQATAPRGGRGTKLKVLGRGLKNFVMSDETTLTEALADARNDVLRDVSSQQLDAFHQTFNFCMTCRQYTCANCWNEVEGRCLTCAPHLGHEVLPAPFPDLQPTAGLAPDILSELNGQPANGNLMLTTEPARQEVPAWPELDLRGLGHDDRGTAIEEPEVAATVAEPEAEVEAVAAVEAEPVAAAEPEVEAVAATVAEPEAEVEAVAAVEAEPVAAAEPEVEAVAATVAEPEAEVEAVAAVEAEPVAAAEPEVEAEPERPTSVVRPPQGLHRLRPRVARPTRFAPVDDRAALAGEPAEAEDDLPHVIEPAMIAEAAEVRVIIAESPEPEPAVEDAVATIEAAAVAEPEVEPAIVAEPQVEPQITATAEAETEPAPPVAASGPLAGRLPAAASATSAQERASAAASQTADLLARFRPGQSLDAALAEYEATHEVVEPEPEPVQSVEPEPEAVQAVEPEPEAVQAVEPEPVVAFEPEPEPFLAVEPEPVAAVAPEPEAEPVAAAEPAPEPQPTQPPRVDRVETPLWTTVAPPTPMKTPDADPGLAAAATSRPAPESTQPQWPVPQAQPQWPAPQGQPQWPAPDASSPVPFLADTRSAAEILWAASNQEVLSRPALPVVGTQPSGGVQPCVSCGLSLSANARFCRRCGTRQG